MQGNTALRKWSTIKGMSIVTIDSGKRVGTVDDFYFIASDHAVRALLVKTGLFGHRALMSSTLNAIGQDAITIKDENELIPEHSDSQLSTTPLGSSLLSYKILSESGVFIGTVHDILLDASNSATLRVDSYELQGGLRERWSGEYTSIRVEHVVRYGQDVIIVKDEVAEALAKH